MRAPTTLYLPREGTLETRAERGADSLHCQYVKRYEFKYLVHLELADRVADYLATYLELDTHCHGRTTRSYTVRSIYFDNPSFRCFHEKLAGKGHREKFRLRTYDEPFSAPLFLEHKIKEGLLYKKGKVHLDTVLLGGMQDLRAYLLDVIDRGDRLLKRFFLGVFRYGYFPMALITYDREAYVHPEDATIRLTLDRHLRARMFPQLTQIYDDEGLENLLPGWVILELKFTHIIPHSIERLVTLFRLRRCTVSKYCTCVGHFLGEVPEAGGVVRAMVV